MHHSNDGYGNLKAEHTMPFRFSTSNLKLTNATIDETTSLLLMFLWYAEVQKHVTND